MCLCEGWLYYQFSLPHLYIPLKKGWENVHFELGSERVNMRRSCSPTAEHLPISSNKLGPCDPKPKDISIIMQKSPWGFAPRRSASVILHVFVAESSGSHDSRSASPSDCQQISQANDDAPNNALIPRAWLTDDLRLCFRGVFFLFLSFIYTFSARRFYLLCKNIRVDTLLLKSYLTETKPTE